MKLFLCTACYRHVKEHDSVCPFCGGARSGTVACDTNRIAPRVSRAALRLLVAAGVAATASACSGSASYGMIDAAPPQDAGDAGSD